MLQCDSPGCTKRAATEILLMSLPVNASSNTRMSQKVCNDCLEQRRRMGEPIRIVRTLMPDETGQVLVGE